MSSLNGVVAGLLCCCARLFAAAEHVLAPCDDEKTEYRARVEHIARKAIPGALELSVVALPSMGPEWIVAVSADSGLHRITHVAFHGSVWD